eukprot:jgi/Bigna1/85666/estExt_fgenesh1_pg.C_50172
MDTGGRAPKRQKRGQDIDTRPRTCHSKDSNSATDLNGCNSNQGGSFSIEHVREHNPEMDTILGRRAYLSSSWEDDGKIGSYSEDQWDDLVDSMVSGKRKKRKGGRRARKTIKYERVTSHKKRDKCSIRSLRFYTLDFRSSFVQGALYAGFFPFATEIQIPGLPLTERCVLDLEICGNTSKGSGTMDKAAGGFTGDTGGRVILEDVKHMNTGKKTVRSLNKHNYELTCTECFEDVLDKIVSLHGIDWLGFRRVRDLLTSLPRLKTTSTNGKTGNCDSSRRKRKLSAANTNNPPSPLSSIRMCSFELWESKNVGSSKEMTDSKDEEVSSDSKKVLVSGEIGFMVGSCYTCLSLFSDTRTYPRCDRVRTQGALLWMAEAGVKLFDVGTTANYYTKLYGFSKVTKRSFVEAWRRHRGTPLNKEGENTLCNRAGIKHEYLTRILRENRERHVSLRDKPI